ncbi:hypothetical protein L7F22_022575 [Adiantum nelumboides]|nr:hypothetical protein [Adiantum nelumboides]
MLGPDLCRDYQHILDIRTMPDSLSKGLIFLIPKERGSLEEIRQWRPITILNSAYKILAKTWTNITQALKLVSCYRVYDVFSLLELLHQMDESFTGGLEENEGVRLIGTRLIVLDSISSVVSPVLSSSYVQGHALMMNCGQKLKRIASDNNLCILVTNHMVTGENRMAKPALGESWKAVSNTRLLITREEGSDTCTVSLRKHSSMVKICIQDICKKKTMAVNESRRTLAGYPLFYGEPGEDADLFVADFKMALRINHIRDPVESMGLFEVTLRKSANTWFTALTPPLNQDFEQVLIAFRAQFGQAQNPQKLWKKILLLRQRTLDDYLTYRQAFNTAWTIWLQSLPNPGDGVEFLKKKQFTAGLIPTLRLKVESGDPVTYHDAERRAYQKYRKLKCLEEEPLPVLRPREVPIQVSNIAPIPVVPMAVGPSIQPTMIDNEVLERLNKSLTNLSIHLAQGVGPRGTIPRSPQERPIRPRRVLTCWNCGEEGHGINNCPYPRGGYGQPPQQLPYPRNHANDPPPRGPVTILQRPNPPLAPIREEAPIPPSPDPGVHVVKVASVRPPAYAKALANGIKRTRGKEKEDTMREDSIPSGREHKREKGET